MSGGAFGNTLRCPYCAYQITANSLVAPTGQEDGYHPPTPGAWSVCVNCASVSRFDHDLGGGLRLRVLTEDEVVEANEDAFLRKVVGAAELAKQLADARGEKP